MAQGRTAGQYGGTPGAGSGPEHGYTGFHALPAPPAPVTVADPARRELKSTAITVRCTPTVRDEFRNRAMVLATLHRVSIEEVNTFVLQELMEGPFFNQVQERLVTWLRSQRRGDARNGQA